MNSAIASELGQRSFKRPRFVERALLDCRNNLPPGASTIDVVDFFSGCGGTSAGLRQAGMTIVAGLDKDRYAAATFHQNFPDATFIEHDIRSVDTDILAEILPPNRNRPVMFSACAPCQPFSKQNRQKETDDERASLLDELERFIRRYLPDYIFLENVPGIQRIESNTGPLKRFRELLIELGYFAKGDVLNFLNYGVPQKRMRFVLLAARNESISLPAPTHGKRDDLEGYSTVWDWIGDLPPIEAGCSNAEVLNHCATHLNPVNLTRIRHTPEGGDRRNWPDHLILDCHQSHKGHTDVYGRLRRSAPASSLTTRCISFSNGRFGHPNQDRALSVREAACLQTFPLSFEFLGTMNSMAMQIGNAVPVLLARLIGEHVIQHCQTMVELEAL
jgi:DNA (cytosine-5)-methyltransferase 1